MLFLPFTANIFTIGFTAEKNYRLFFAIAVKVPPKMTLPLAARKRYRLYIYMYHLSLENYCIIALPSRFVTALRVVTAVYREILNNC